MSKTKPAQKDKTIDFMADDDRLVLGRAYDSRLVRRLLAYLGPYRAQLISAVLLMVISALLSVAAPWIIGRAIDDGLRGGDFSRLRLWTAAFTVAAVLEWLTNRGRLSLMAFVGTKVVADVRSALFHHLQTLSLTFFNNYSVGRLMSRLSSDVEVLQDFITWSITGLFRALFTLTGIVVVMLAMNWQLALITFVVLPIMAIMTNYWRLHVREAYRATRSRLSLINGYLNESITGIRVTKSFTREEKNAAHFDGLNRAYLDANVEAARLSAFFFPAVDFMGAVATALVVAAGGWYVLGDVLTAGTLVAFILYVERFFQPIRELAQRYNVFQSTMAASERLFNLLDMAPDLTDRPDAKPLPAIKGHVRFETVSFGYKEDELVLQDIDLTAQPGQRIALVGETGAGKSTMIRLLARFFDVTSGRILIDDHDISRVTRASLRAQLGIVLQDTFLFSGTVMDNVRYGRLDASDEMVVAAADAVGADRFIRRMPEGYQTEVGENGVNLSVGQRQMISFARAILADPRILILDEATSSVDTTTEKHIEKALDRLMVGRTSFVIAHRLSTIVNADRIVVLDQGRIIESGQHETLLKQGGRYFHLYTMQWAVGSDPEPAAISQN